jgi:3-hydroxyacyl-[acyl-carrier-protein] dehydratase
MTEAVQGAPGTNVSVIEINEIMRLLPHRYPMLMIDRVLALNPGESITALKNVSMNEPFFPGHYPHHPVMPGVLVVEAMAQAAAILAFKSMAEEPDARNVYYFVGIDGARFKRPVVPGDQLKLDVKFVLSKRGLWKFSAKASVDGQTAAEAEIMCTMRSV